MKKKFIFYLVFTILCLCTIISFIVLRYANLKTEKMLNGYKSDALSHLKDYISILDKNLIKIEGEIFSEYDECMNLLVKEIEQHEKVEDITDEQLRSMAERFNIGEVYIINKEGVVFKTTYKNDYDLNLFNINNDMEEFLQNIYGKGSTFSHRALISKYNKFNKFLYYSPKGSDYIIEISVDVKDYVKYKYGDEYLKYLFNDVLEVYNHGNEYLSQIDVYDITNYVNWSILMNNSRFNEGEAFIQSIDRSNGLTVKQGSKVKFYHIITDSQKTQTYFGKELLLEAEYDFSSLHKFAENIIVLSILSVLLIGAAAFILASKFINTHYTERILKINHNLNLVEQGVYSDNLLFNEEDEISQIASNLNKMKEKIVDRELQLKNKLLELEKITRALKESEEKLEYDKLKTEFFANISHEFKTPLNIILSSLQLLDLYLGNGIIIDEHDKLKHYMKGMRQNSYRLLRLINNMIDITKIETSFFHMETNNHDIVALVESMVLSTRAYTRVKGIILNLKKDIEERIIACDPDMMERIILNLMSNAIKFTPEGGNIDVNIYERKEWVHISVKDDGIGIPSDKLNIIFERFRQVDKSFSRNAEGSGIGLSLVKALVEMHNGSISVKSEYGKGSEFIVMLPAKVLDEAEGDSSGDLFKGTKIEKLNVEFSDIYS